LPSTWTVDRLDDSDAGGTLRWAVAQADADPDPAGAVVRFDPTVFSTNQIITLTSPLVLSQAAGPIAIEGPGAALLTVSGGDAVQVFRVDAGATASISGLTITRGRDNQGGAINNAGRLVLSNSNIRGNTAASISRGADPVTGQPFPGTPGSGGGVYNSGLMMILGTSMSDNTTEPATINRYIRGGGAGGAVHNSGIMSIVNSTISGNQLLSIFSSGGGIYNSGSLSLADVTIADNAAYYGGSLAIAGDPKAQATSTGTIFSNTPDVGVLARDGFGESGVENIVIAAGGVFRSLGHNLFSDAPDAPTGPTDLIDVDPMLGPLADNGGPTPTMALLPGSPALDAGGDVAGVAVDQRGVPRPQGDSPDVGAFELRGMAPSFTLLASPTIVYGAATVSLSGRIAAGDQIPPGVVAVTLDGDTRAAAIDPATGAFAVAFPAAGLHVAPSPYAVTYRYDARGEFLAADAAGTLAVTPAPLTVIADDRTVPFGMEIPPLAATYLGLVGGDGPADLTRPATLSTVAVAYSLPGRYAIVASGAESADYAIAYVDGVLTVAEPAGRRARGGIAFLSSLYRDTLGRAVEPEGLRSWMGRLDAGRRPIWVARGIWDSREHRSLVRGRTAPDVDPAAAWSRAMRAWRNAAGDDR